MNFSQLELIRAIQEKGSISAAADLVGLTQSAASRALSTLEDELGVTLIDRTRSGAVLTEIGAYLLPHVYEILARAELIRQETAARRGLSVGKLRIGSVPSISSRLFTQLVGTFQHRYPGIETVVFEGHETEIQSWLGQGIVDVGLLAHPSPESVVVPIAQDEMKVLVARNHPFRERHRVRVRDLGDEPFVMSKSNCTPFMYRLFEEAGVPFNLRLELSDVNTVLAMVKEGFGITVAPDIGVPELLAGLHVLGFDPPIYRHLYAAASNTRAASPAASAFLELARDLTRCAEDTPSDKLMMSVEEATQRILQQA